MPTTVVAKSAVISDDGVYRYLLTRQLASGNPLKLGVLMANPSDADAERDDPTIRRLYGFADRLGYGIILVGNKFAQRTPHIKKLAFDPVVAAGPSNDNYVEQIIHCADMVLVAWGPLAKFHPSLRNRWKDIVRMADDVNKPLYCLGTAQDGHPRHPLMLPSDAPLQQWRL